MPYAISPTSMQGLSSVKRSLDILTNGVGQCDWREVRMGMDLPPSRIVRRPSERYTRREWVSYVVASLALFDVAYLLKTPPDSEGVPNSLIPLDPNHVAPVVAEFPQILPPDAYTVYGSPVPASALCVLRRSPQPGVSEDLGGVLRLARMTFATALSAEAYASRYWQTGGSPSIVLETDQRLTAPQKAELSQAWRDRKAMGPDYAPVIDGGLKARDFGADPTAASAVEARRELVADIGRYFGIPTFQLNAPAGDSQTYRNGGQSNADLIRYTLQDYIQAIEDAITDLLPGGRELRLDTWRLTRATALEEAQAYQLATAGRPWMTPDDVRERLGLCPMEIEPETGRPAMAWSAPSDNSQSQSRVPAGGESGD